jgi:hypothetical protein
MMQVPGRQNVNSLGTHMRFVVDEARAGFNTARAIQMRLETIAGALLVSVNPKTGDALILFEEDDITREQLTEQVRKLGFLRDARELAEVGCC